MNNLFDEYLKKIGIEIITSAFFLSSDEEISFTEKFKYFKDNGVEFFFFDNNIHQIIDNMNKDECSIGWLKNFNFFLLKNVFISNHEFAKDMLNLIIDGKKKIFENAKKDDYDLKLDLSKKIKKYKINLLYDCNLEGIEGNVNDFVIHFNNRLRYYHKIISEKNILKNTYRISNLKDILEPKEQISIIGLLTSIEFTAKGHVIMIIEDRSGYVKCILKNEKLNDRFKLDRLCLDEGIGISGKMGNNVLWIDDIVTVDDCNNKYDEPIKLNTTNLNHKVLLTSDFHIGSKDFDYVSFYKLLKFLNSLTGNSKLDNLAKEIETIIIPGDLVYGIGKFEHEHSELLINETAIQYELVHVLLKQIPEDKCIIIIPGNHDVSRIQEPQTKIPYDFAHSLYRMDNVILLSNPSSFELYNEEKTPLSFYLYHGSSIHYYALNIEYLQKIKEDKKRLIETVKFFIDKKHISPTHNFTPYVCESLEDGLRLDKNYDFFLYGHTHYIDNTDYKNCSIINCGTFSKQTLAQKENNINPDVGKCILIDTKTRKLKILNFSGK